MTPSHIGRYRVVSLLGAGGMGEVYLAEDTSLGRQVALKLLPPATVADSDRARRFAQEARLASAVTHPNIAQIFESATAIPACSSRASRASPNAAVRRSNPSPCCPLPRSRRRASSTTWRTGSAKA